MKHGSMKGRDCKGAKFGCDSYTDYYKILHVCVKI